MDRALLNTIVAIHRSDSLASLRAAFLEHVPSTLEADAFGIYLLHPQLRDSGPFIGSAPQAFLQEYESGLRPLDPIFEFVTRERSVIDGTTLLGARRWREHPLRAWLDRWGWQYSLQGPLVLGGEVAGTVNFARGASGGGFTARNRWLARVICDEIGAALARLVEHETTVRQLALVRACFDSLPVPAIVTDTAGRVREINERARHCGNRDCTSWRARALLHPDAASEAPPCGAARCDTAASVPLPGFDHLFLSSWACCTASACHPLEGLPPRSRVVAKLLIEGHQIKSIAWQLGIAQDTVKDHIKRIYRRLGVSSRTQLLRLATSRRH